MGIRTFWDNADKTIVRLDFASWGWLDVHAAIEEFLALSATVDYPVAALLNLREANVVPLEGALTNMQYLFHMLPDKLALVGVKPLGKIMLNIFFSMQPSYRQRVFLAETLDEARTLLNAARQIK